MKIIYTAKEVGGRWPEHSRIARESLIAIIEESLVNADGLVKSYTITNNNQFPFPHKSPNIIEMNPFFGSSQDYNCIAQEIKELFEQPKRELEESASRLNSELKTATSQQILEMVERYHYAPKEARKTYNEELKRVRSLLKPYEELSRDLTSTGFNKIRTDLAQALLWLDNIGVRSLLADLKKTENLLAIGRRDEAIEMVKSYHHDWTRKNLAKLYNYCGDADYYGQGFWIARMVDSGKLYKNSSGMQITIEEALNYKNMPYQVLNL